MTPEFGQHEAAAPPEDGAAGNERLRKAPNAYRTISEVADDLHVPQHVLRFWETRFPEVRPLKRGGGRRYYRPEDIDVLRRISELLYVQGYTIKGVQRVLRGHGPGEESAGSAPILAEETMTDAGGDDIGCVPDDVPGPITDTGHDMDSATGSVAPPDNSERDAEAIDMIGTTGLPPEREDAQRQDRFEDQGAALDDARREAATLRQERARLRAHLRDVLEELRLIRAQIPA